MQVSSFFANSSFVLFFGFCATAVAASLHHSQPHRTPGNNVTLPLPQKLIYQFPFMTWIENLAVRSNGEIITILLGQNKIYTLSPTAHENTTATANLIATIPSRTSTFAIAELEPDIFYVSCGNFSMTTGVIDPGSFSIFSLDFNVKSGEAIKISKVADLPNAQLLNGMVALPSQGQLLVPDSYAGLIWAVDVKTGKVGIALDIPETHSLTARRVGVNGVKLHGGFLYFTNSELKSLYRVPFSNHKGCVVEDAKVEKLATDSTFMDDFAVSSTHSHGILEKDDKEEVLVWVATNQGNVVKVVKVGGEGGKGELVTVAGEVGGLDVAGPTACAFGRGEKDKHVLYVVTTGGLSGGVEGGKMEGGKVVGVDTEGFRL